MGNEGPPLEALLHRLAECPPEFLAEPRIGSTGQVEVVAVVADLLRALGGSPLSSGEVAVFRPGKRREHRNRLRTVLVAAWLLHDDWFQGQGGFASAAYRFLTDAVSELAGLVPAAKLVSDPDRREELARLALQSLGLRPSGETVAQASDRLTTLNTAERLRVIREAQAAEERARQIREAMQQEAARTAAARYTPE